MAGENPKVVADQDRVCETESLNTFGDLPDLCARMPSRVTQVRAESGDIDHFDRQGTVSTQLVHDRFLHEIGSKARDMHGSLIATIANEKTGLARDMTCRHSQFLVCPNFVRCSNPCSLAPIPCFVLASFVRESVPIVAKALKYLVLC
jgi:hypothetical protein